MAALIYDWPVGCGYPLLCKVACTVPEKLPDLMFATRSLRYKDPCQDVVAAAGPGVSIEPALSSFGKIRRPRWFSAKGNTRRARWMTSSMGKPRLESNSKIYDLIFKTNTW